jgi:hypothetical protein
MLLTLEAPSATSVGLCLAHSVIDKSAWLAHLGLTDVTWPMNGKPRLCYTDFVAQNIVWLCVFQDFVALWPKTATQPGGDRQ